MELLAFKQLALVSHANYLGNCIQDTVYTNSCILIHQK